MTGDLFRGGCIAQAREGRERLARGGQEPLDPKQDKLHDIVRRGARANALELPSPATLRAIEVDRARVAKLAQKLEREERIASGLFDNEPGEVIDLGARRAQRLGAQLAHVCASERGERDLGKRCIRSAQASNGVAERVRFIDFVAAVRADDEDVRGFRMRHQVFDEVERSAIQPLQITVRDSHSVHTRFTQHRAHTLEGALGFNAAAEGGSPELLYRISN